MLVRPSVGMLPGSPPLARGADSLTWDYTAHLIPAPRTPPYSWGMPPCGMRIDYRDLITNLHRSVHDDMGSARIRLRGTVELLEQADLTAAGAADLRAAQQRLDEVAHR